MLVYRTPLTLPPPPSKIGNAKVLNQESGDNLLTETRMTNGQYTISLTLLLVAFVFCEAPSTYTLKRFRPSRWIAFLMFMWGSMTMALGGTHSFASVTTVRFFLGVFEAGLFPGLMYYLTFWYRADERSVRMALVLASATLAGAFGGAIAYGVGHMNRTGGLSVWLWLFILEGIPSILSSFFALFLLPDYPETTPWLSTAEKCRAAERL
ncbi:putative major facilitator superfamily, MFS transporter superfamily [Septoria linicola]|nr:putative major facilitator superfamily, MFS transporter superfamily [Septoria linicola]